MAIWLPSASSPACSKRWRTLASVRCRWAAASSECRPSLTVHSDYDRDLVHPEAAAHGHWYLVARKRDWQCPWRATRLWNRTHQDQPRFLAVGVHHHRVSRVRVKVNRRDFADEC